MKKQLWRFARNVMLWLEDKSNKKSRILRDVSMGSLVKQAAAYPAGWRRAYPHSQWESTNCSSPDPPQAHSRTEARSSPSVEIQKRYSFYPDSSGHPDSSTVR